MEEPALRDVDRLRDVERIRDVERWKDKIEVRLDNRQVFFLFFGSALCACMLFVLGVIVGKRLESRGRAAAPEVQDPLAVLDRINSIGVAAATAPGAVTATSAAAASAKADAALTFPKALIASSAPVASPRPVAARTATVAIAPAVAKPVLTAVRPPVVLAKLPAPAPVAKVPVPLKVATVAAPPLPAPAPAVKAPTPTPAKLPAVSINRTATAPAPKPVPVAAPAASPKGRFTLQLNSFPDKSEAEAFAKRFSAQGAFIVASEIPGKGTFYRVRVGNYGSSQEAIAAKGSFEKQTNTIAYIAGR